MTYHKMIEAYLKLLESTSPADRKYAIENIRSIVIEMQLTIDNYKTLIERNKI